MPAVAGSPNNRNGTYTAHIDNTCDILELVTTTCIEYNDLDV